MCDQLWTLISGNWPAIEARRCNLGKRTHIRCTGHHFLRMHEANSYEGDPSQIHWKTMSIVCWYSSRDWATTTMFDPSSHRLSFSRQAVFHQRRNTLRMKATTRTARLCAFESVSIFFFLVETQQDYLLVPFVHTPRRSNYVESFPFVPIVSSSWCYIVPSYERYKRRQTFRFHPPSRRSICVNVKIFGEDCTELSILLIDLLLRPRIFR